MIVQVFAIKSVKEMQMCIDAGLDRWGLEVGKKGIMPSEMTFEKTRTVFDATPENYPKMALTIDTDMDDLVEMYVHLLKGLFQYFFLPPRIDRDHVVHNSSNLVNSLCLGGSF